MALVLNGSTNAIGGLAVGGVPDGTIDKDALAAEAAGGTKLGNGGIIQVKHVHFTGTDSSSIAGGTDGHTNEWIYDNANLRVGLTPTNASNKILVTGQMSLGNSAWSIGVYTRLYRKLGSGSGALVGNGTAASNRPVAITNAEYVAATNSVAVCSFSYLDSAANTTDEHIYYCGFMHNSSSTRTIYLNRHHDDADNYYSPRLTSSITLMEVVA